MSLGPLSRVPRSVVRCSALAALALAAAACPSLTRGALYPQTRTAAATVRVARPLSRLSSPTSSRIVPDKSAPVATASPTRVPTAPMAGGASRGYSVGAYYFSGWSHEQNDNLTPLLTRSPLRRYEPLIGWYDDSQRQVDRTIDQAAGTGIDFFAFDWYDLAHIKYATDRTLNNALGYYLSSGERPRLRFCLNFVDQEPFVPHAADWPRIVKTWMRYFLQPDYVRVGGKPLLIVFSPEHMRAIFGGLPADRGHGGSINVRKALDYLRSQARRYGLPGVTVAVGATVTPRGNPANYGRLRNEGYDITTGYNYHATGGEQTRVPAPYSRLVQENEGMWDRVAANLPYPYIPVITMGWDQRFSVREQRTIISYVGRTSGAFACYAAAARRWIDAHPTRTVPERIVLVYAWNEIGEGGALIPNHTDGYAYTNVIRQVFGAPGQPPATAAPVC